LVNNDQAYTVTDDHFSVYEDLKLENRRLQSHYQLAINVVNQLQQLFSIRIQNNLG
jgi:hypothetical protein